ncbi:MAG: phosphatase PAP2 family protein [Dehalococcoidia bacterium]|nr:phosphatase PAP2 family protein [Dehalococcoidia bacterium]
MRRPYLALAAGLWLVLLGLTLALSVLAAEHDTLPGDRGIMSWAQDLPFPGETLADSVRAITSTEVVLAAGAAVALVLWLRGHRRQALLLAIGLALLPLLSLAVKELVDRPRPGPPEVELRAGYSSPSFPSGHVMSGSILYGFLLYLSLFLPVARGARAALAALAAAVLLLAGPANVYLGVHWPSDVLGAWAWALLVLLPALTADRALSAGRP